MKILVTGGTGYLGSHTVVELVENGYVIPDTSGIYVFVRTEKFAYIGQSVSLRKRVISHLKNYDQRIDISLKKRKLYSQDNQGGWDILINECPVSELNEQERNEIQYYLDNGYTLYNITNGGQNSGKIDINERKQGKTYKQGVEYGQIKKMREIKEFFDKYLEVTIKGTPNKIKERKLQEFREMLKDGRN